MIQNFRTRLYNTADQAFSLIEMLVVVLILGVLAAVAVPVYLGVQAQASESTIKTGLMQAGALIDQEKTDLDGVYPRYIPNEVKQNELWGQFVYTYSDDRLTYCLQAYDSNNNRFWYLGSVNKNPSRIACTQANKGSNSLDPSLPKTPPLGNVSALTMTWPEGAATPTAKLVLPDAQCENTNTLYTPVTTYNVRLTDVSESVTITFTGASGTSASYDKLPGFLPNDTVQATFQTVCTTNQNVVTGAFSPRAATAVTPDLPVPATAYSSKPAAYLQQNTSTKAFTMLSTGTFTPVTCPIGTNLYQITAVQSGVSSVSSAASNNTTQAWTLTNFKPDTRIDYTGYAYCVITRKTSDPVTKTAYASTAVNANEYAPVGWPDAITNLATTSAYSGTGTTPNGLTWTATTCTFGGTPYYSYIRTYPDANNSAFQTQNGAGPIAWSQGQRYTYRVDSKCVGNNGPESRVVSSANLDFVTDVTPGAVNWNANPGAYNPSQTTMAATGTLSTTSCPSGSTPAYGITAVQASTGNSRTSTPSSNRVVSIDLSGYAPDTAIYYVGNAYCYVPQVDGSSKPYLTTTPNPQVSEYTPVATPNAAGTWTDNLSGDTDVLPNRMVAADTSCPYGGSIRYRFYMTSPANGTSDWSSSRALSGYFSNGINMSNLNNGQTYRVGTQTYCQGSNRSSAVATGNTIDFTAYYGKPAAAATPGAIWVSTTDPNQAQYVSWNGISCNRGATAQYRMIQSVHNGTTYGDNNNWNTGWTTATSAYTSNWLDWQGAYYQYSVRARCVNANFTSDESNWRDTGWFIEGIATPGTPGYVRSNNFSRVDWNGVGCGSGTYPTYYVIQDENDWSWYNRELANRTGNTYVDNVYGGVSGQERVWVQAYCNSGSIGGVASGGSGIGYSNQWQKYGSPGLGQFRDGNCQWPDVFYYNECGVNYSTGYPGISGSGTSGVNGLSLGTDGVVRGSVNNPGGYNIYGILYNAAGNSGWQWLGYRSVTEYGQGWHDASYNWYADYGSNYQPCTLYNSNSPGPGCSSSGWNSNRTNINKFVIRGSQRGQMKFDTKGLVNGTRYRFGCSIGYSAGSTGQFARFGLWINGVYDTQLQNPSPQTWYDMYVDWTYTGGSAPYQTQVTVFADNNNSSEREIDVTNCYINQI